MAQITLRGNPINTVGDPAVGAQAPAFALTGTDLGEVANGQFDGKTVVLNIFPSVDTPVCATSVRSFNERAAATGVSGGVRVEGPALRAEAVLRCRGHRGTSSRRRPSQQQLRRDYGITIADGPMAGLLEPRRGGRRRRRQVAYTELVPDRLRARLRRGDLRARIAKYIWLHYESRDLGDFRSHSRGIEKGRDMTISPTSSPCWPRPAARRPSPSPRPPGPTRTTPTATTTPRCRCATSRPGCRPPPLDTTR